MQWHWQDIINGSSLLLSGLGLTLLLSVVALTGGFTGGCLLAIGRYHYHDKTSPALWQRALVYFSAAIIEVTRTIPLILFLVFTHYGLMFAINTALGRPSNIIESSMIALILFESVYLAEIIRGGLMAIQTEERFAAKSLGLTTVQQYGFIYLPLAIRRSMGALIGQGISLIKDTSLTSVLGVLELTRQGEIIYQNTYHDLEVLIAVSLIYFILCYSLYRFSLRFEGQAAALR